MKKPKRIPVTICLTAGESKLLEKAAALEHAHDPEDVKKNVRRFMKLAARMVALAAVDKGEWKHDFAADLRERTWEDDKAVTAIYDEKPEPPSTGIWSDWSRN